jgi:hypothetical protein
MLGAMDGAAQAYMDVLAAFLEGPSCVHAAATRYNQTQRRRNRQTAR